MKAKSSPQPSPSTDQPSSDAARASQPNLKAQKSKDVMRVALMPLSHGLFLISANLDGSIPLNSRVLARLDECTQETALEIVRAINLGIGATSESFPTPADPSNDPSTLEKKSENQERSDRKEVT